MTEFYSESMRLSGASSTLSGAGAPVDREEAVSLAAVESGLVSPRDGRAALVVSRVTQASVSAVLHANGLVDRDTARRLDDEVNEHLIPGYRILAKIGRGSQGIVYRAVQKCLDRNVALKVVSLRSALAESMHLRLQREARAIARVSHRNVVAAYDFGESRGRMYLAMEFVEGTSCDQALAQRAGPLTPIRALGIARDVALGLECAMAEGIIHRDIKPANILLPAARDGASSGPPVNAKIADLGLSRMGASDLTIEGTVLGTPGYMAPEQARGEEVDHRADIYALGATLYHMVTGLRPFGAPEVFAVLVRQVCERIADPRELHPFLSAGLVYLLQGMMSRSPATRYGDYGDLIRDIDRVAAGGKPLLPLPPSRDRSIRAPGRRTSGALDLPTCLHVGSRILVLDRDGPALARLLDGPAPPSAVRRTA